MARTIDTREEVAALKARFETHEAQCRERHEHNERDHATMFRKLDEGRKESWRRWWWLLTFIIASQGVLIAEVFKLFG